MLSLRESTMQLHERCQKTCQWAADVAMPEYACVSACQLLDSDEPYPGQAPCPACFESSGYKARCHPDTWEEPGWAEPDPMRPCEECGGTGTVDSPLATFDDLEELAAEEGTAGRTA